MEYEKLKIGDLKAYEGNAKTHPPEQIELLSKGISKFGFNQPIVVDKDNVVIAGHGRLLAAEKLGLKELPVVRKENLSEADVKAYRLFDNKIAETDWDLASLGVELKGLQELNYDMEFTAFNFNELDILMDQPIKNVNSEILINNLEKDLKYICPKCGFKYETNK